MPEKMKKLGKNYIKPVEVESGDIYQIIKAPTLRVLDKDTSKQRERYEIEVKGYKAIHLEKKWRIVTLNTTSSDLLTDAFGDDPEAWLNKLVVVQKRLEKVGKEDKEVLYFEPYLNPQVELPKPESPTPSTPPVWEINPNELTQEQREAIAEIIHKK